MEVRVSIKNTENSVSSGAGLFMGSASTIKWTGPSVMLAYAIAALYLFYHAFDGRNALLRAFHRIIR